MTSPNGANTSQLARTLLKARRPLSTQCKAVEPCLSVRAFLDLKVPHEDSFLYKMHYWGLARQLRG